MSVARMLPQLRRKYIIEAIHQNGSVAVQSLSQELNINEQTIRRDLAELQSCGIVTRIRGGAILADPTTEPVSSPEASLHASARHGLAAAIEFLDVGDALAAASMASTAVAQLLNLNQRAGVELPPDDPTGEPGQ